MRRTLLCIALFAPVALGASLSGTWKFTPPPNPQAPANRQPRETIYVFKVDGAPVNNFVIAAGRGVDQTPQRLECQAPDFGLGYSHGGQCGLRELSEFDVIEADD